MDRKPKPLLERLRCTHDRRDYIEDTVGFMGKEGGWSVSRNVPDNPDGKEAADLIERLQGALERYGAHDVGCGANDLDYLDDTPCTCGLRAFVNPKGRAALAQEGRDNG